MKGSKIWLIIATVLMISGLGLAAVGTANGGSWRFKIKNFKVTTKADNDYVTEKKQKARQIMGLKKDLLLEEKSLEEARTYNETLNNNKTTIESKIEEIRNMQAISAGDKALANLGDGNTAEILQSNVERMMREQQIREQKLAILKNGNNAINAGLGFKDEDDYLKNLLGNNGNAGGAPVFY